MPRGLHTGWGCPERKNVRTRVASVRSDGSVVNPALHFFELLRADAAGGHLGKTLALEPQRELAVPVAGGQVGASPARPRGKQTLRVADRVALEKREPA